MIRRILRRLARRATTPLRLWINRQRLAASEREIERLRQLRSDTRTREQAEQQAMVKITVRLQAIERGLL